MLLIYIDILERIIKYLKPFAASRSGERTETAPSQPFPPPDVTSSAFFKDQLIDTAVPDLSLGADLVTRVSSIVEPTGIDGPTQQLADALMNARDDARNKEGRLFGKRKLGKIYLADGDTVIFDNLYFTEVMWLQLRFDFAGPYIFIWKRGAS